MRIYLPATLLELTPAADGTLAPLAPRRAHTVTRELRELFPDDDDEGLEYAAQLAAADDSLERLRADPSAPRLRLVLTAEVPDGVVARVDDDEAAASAVDLTASVGWAAVACGHVDEPDARPDVAAALIGAPAAVERLDERDLLWYDASELSVIPR